MNGIRRYRSRFTLIELLAVVALISILMAVGVPAFARMIRGSKVDESARSIKLALEQAQMRSASERCYVAVIFPNGGDGAVDSSLAPYRLGGFRTAYVKKNSGGGYEFAKWADAGWRNAPSGAILTRVGTSKFDPDNNGDVTNCTEKTNSALEGASALKEVSGVRDNNQELKVGSHTAIIFNQYGGIEGGSKLYLLVSEAVVEGDKITYPTAGTAGGNRTSNYKVLKVNNLTGRVEFSE